MRKILYCLIAAILMIPGINLFSQTYTWTELTGGINGNVKTIAEYNNRIVIAGGFTKAGNVFVSNIVEWDEDEGWIQLGPGFNDTVYCLAVYNNELYAGGRFTQSGSNIVNHIAKWTGTGWSQVGFGGGMNDIVRDMVVYNNNLVAAGYFTQAGGFPANRIAVLNGILWQPLGSGFNNDVYTLNIFNGNIVAGGKFTTSGVDTVNFIAGYINNSWQPLGFGMNDRVYALEIFNGQLVAGGSFTTAGNNVCNYIASWNGMNWSPYNSGMDKTVLSLAVYSGELVAGGEFKYAGGTYCDRVALWHNSNWKRLLTGMNAKVNALLSSTSLTGPKLFAGGEYTTAGGKYAKHISYWSEVATITVSGTVKYQDNNAIVNSGRVKAFRVDVNTREIIYLDSGIITNGVYIIGRLPIDTVYIISLPDDELLGDFVPTYYTSTINWASAAKVFSTVNISNVNIFVYRTNGTLQDLGANISGHVYLNFNPPVGGTSGLPYKNDAILYLKQNNQFRKYTLSNSFEEYSLNNLPAGTYDIFVYRAGYTSGYRSVTLSTYNLDTINFYLDTVSLTEVKKISEQVPDKFRLEQNYPNPFNPSTTIIFFNPLRDNIKIVVYNLLGQEVAILLNDVMQPGIYEIHWNASAYPSGIYFYKLQTSGFTETKKMILVK